MATSGSNHSSVKHLGDPSYSSHLSSALNQLRQQASLCDVTIIVGDQRFQAHKAVLSCASDYFQVMFSSGFQESTRSEVTVPGTEESFAKLLDFAYTGYFTLSPTTAADTLKVACYMMFPQAMEVCANYLSDIRDKIPIEECFEIWSIASNHDSLSDFAKSFRKHLTRNFPKCVETGHFLEHATANFLMESLCNEEIETDACTEQEILQGTVNWLKYDWEQRKIHTVDLLKKIRLGLIPVDRLKKILTLDIPECKEIMEEVDKLHHIISYHFIKKSDITVPLNQIYLDLFATRNTITAPLSLALKNSMMKFRCRTEIGCYQLGQIADLPYIYPYPDADEEYDNGFSVLVTDNNQLYVAGGLVDEWFHEEPTEQLKEYRRWNSENNFFRYDAEKNEWNILTPMLEVKTYPKLLELNGYIYVLDCSEIIQRYNHSSKEWEKLKSKYELNLFIKDAVVFNGCILFKGFDHLWAVCNEYRVQYKLYNPITRRWSNVTCNSPTGYDDTRAQLIVHKNVCYLFENKSRRKRKSKYVVHRLVCDLERENPTITTEEVLDQKTTFGVEMMYLAATLNSPHFTFDKRKLGMSKESCECQYHNKHDKCKC